MTEAAHEVRVIEAYRDYASPFNVAKTVRMLLGYVPAKYLAGLKTVVLMNKGAMSHDKRRRKLWSRGRKISMDRVLGTYHQAWKGDPAWIEIHVDRIISTLPGKSTKWVPPFLRTFAFAEVLYHEIGHHIHKTVRPEYREREDVADAWRDKLRRSFMRSRYWYLVPAAAVYKAITKPTSRSDKRRPA